MGRPMDFAAAIIGSGGAMTVIDGRGNAWIYNAGANEDGPQSFDAAFIRGDTLVVMAGDEPWAYKAIDGTWTKGVKLEVKEGQEEEVWQEAGNVSQVAPPPEDEGEPAPSASKAKAKKAEKEKEPA